MRLRIPIGTFALTAALLWVAAPAGAQTNWGVGVTTPGDIFFCDLRRDLVWKLDTSRQLSVALADTHCRALVVGPDGLVYGEGVNAGTRLGAPSDVVHTSLLGIWRLGLSGTAFWIEPPTMTPDPSLWVVADGDGRSYGWTGAVPQSKVSQIVRHEQTGLSFPVAGGDWGQRDGQGGDAQLGRIAGFALAPDGTLVVADGGNIRRVTALGHVTTESLHAVSDAPGGLVGQAGLWDHAMGVAADADGSAVVVDYPAHRIVRIARDGRARELWHSGGLANWITGLRWGWRPTGVAMLRSGAYVMEDWPMPALAADLVGSPRILLVRPDGSYDHVVAVSSWFARILTLLVIVVVLSWARARRQQPQ